MKFVAQTKPRMKKILRLAGDPKDSPLSQRLAHELHAGKLLIVDNNRLKISVASIDDYPDLELLPDCEPEVEIKWIDHKAGTEHDPVPLSRFEGILPNLNFEDVSIRHEGLNDWVPLATIKRMVLGD